MSIAHYDGKVKSKMVSGLARAIGRTKNLRIFFPNIL
jgi:hypothetical protein